MKTKYKATLSLILTAVLMHPSLKALADEDKCKHHIEELAKMQSVLIEKNFPILLANYEKSARNLDSIVDWGYQNDGKRLNASVFGAPIKAGAQDLRLRKFEFESYFDRYAGQSNNVITRLAADCLPSTIKPNDGSNNK